MQIERGYLKIGFSSRGTICEGTSQGNLAQCIWVQLQKHMRCNACHLPGLLLYTENMDRNLARNDKRPLPCKGLPYKDFPVVARTMPY